MAFGLDESRVRVAGYREECGFAAADAAQVPALRGRATGAPPGAGAEGRPPEPPQLARLLPNPTPPDKLSVETCPDIRPERWITGRRPGLADADRSTAPRRMNVDD